MITNNCKNELFILDKSIYEDANMVYNLQIVEDIIIIFKNKEEYYILK